MNSPSKDEYIKTDRYKVQVPVIALEHQKIGTKIDLVGAIHIAAPRYYDEVLSLLNQDDIVLYEMCGLGTSDNAIKERFLFPLKINVTAFYKELAKHASNYYGKYFSQLNSLLSKISLDDPKADPEVTELKRRLNDIMWELQQTADILNADADVQLVYQWDRINYDNLPNHRENADITKQELVNTMNVFSLRNAYFLSAKIALAVARKYFIKKIVKEVINGKLDSSMTSKNSTWAQFHRQREESLYKKIHEYENSVNKIGIFYGAWHLKNIEQHLLQHWYTRKNITYLDSIRKYSKVIEEKNNEPNDALVKLRQSLT